MEREQLALLDVPAPALPVGARLFRGHLGRAEQCALLDAVAEIAAAAPFFRPRMKNGTPLICRMTNCGPLGWLSDERGYRYEPLHPETGRPWPPMPAALRRIAAEASAAIGVTAYDPDACLVNEYVATGKMNLHRDYDECDFAWPIVSISLGSDAVFALGGLGRRDPAQRFVLRSGDVLILGGESRLRFHGVARIVPGTQPFAHPVLPDGGRINLTLRRAR